jgi:hypothetical protein
MVLYHRKVGRSYRWIRFFQRIKDEIKLEENGLRALRKPKSELALRKTNKIVGNRIFSANCYENHRVGGQ